MDRRSLLSFCCLMLSLRTSARSLLSNSLTNDPFTIPVYYPVADGFGKVATNISWGTPAQAPVRTTFDTGSFQFWVDTNGSYINSENQQTGSDCSYRVTHYFPHVYTYQLSKTHTPLVPDPIGGASYGNAKTVDFPKDTSDTMTWNMSKPSVSLQSQRVGLATNTSTTYQAGSCSDNAPGGSVDVSILGMGPNSTWRSDLRSSGKLDNLAWSIWFTKPKVASSFAPISTFYGSARIGDSPPKGTYSGNLVNIPLVTSDADARRFYTIVPPTLHVRGTEIPRIAGSTGNMIIDSGTTQDMVPFSQKAIIAASGGDLIFYTANGGFIYFAYNGTCESIPAELTLDYTFAGRTTGQSTTVKVPFKNYALGPVGTNGTEAKLCNLNNFVPSSKGFLVFGAPFFTATTMYFQDGKKQIGIAQGGVQLAS